MVSRHGFNRWVVMRLKVLLFAAVVAAPAAGWLALTRTPVDIDAVRPRLGEALEAVYASGVVDTVVDAKVGAVAPGRVMEVAVREGDGVEKGDLLALLDDRAAASQLAEAEARLALAEAEEVRAAELTRRAVASQQTLERAAAETRVAKALVDIAERAVADRRILSPLRGFVMNRMVEPGESVAANTPLFIVAAERPLIVEADVDERDAPRVFVGAEVALGAEAFPQDVFTSKVARIRPLGDSATRTYRVEAALPDDTPLLPGMTVDVNILLSRRADAMLLPARAVGRERSQGGAPGAAYVWLVQPGGKLERRPVTVGADGPQTVEISDGLDLTAVVAANPTAAAAAARLGRPVRPKLP